MCACQSAHDTHTKMPLTIRCFMSIGWIPSEINGFGQITQNLPKILHSMAQPQLASPNLTQILKWTKSFHQWIICGKKVLSCPT